MGVESTDKTSSLVSDFETHPKGTGADLRRLWTENSALKETIKDLRELLAKAQERLRDAEEKHDRAIARQRRLGL